MNRLHIARKYNLMLRMHPSLRSSSIIVYELFSVRAQKYNVLSKRTQYTPHESFSQTYFVYKTIG
jgi:hypothetical protein